MLSHKNMHFQKYKTDRLQGHTKEFHYILVNEEENRLQFILIILRYANLSVEGRTIL